MAFLKVLFKKGYNVILYNQYNSVYIKKYYDFSDKQSKLPTLTKNHHDFIGWSYTKDGNNSPLFKNVENINPYKYKNISLYPIFQKKEVYITYHALDANGVMEEDNFLAGNRVRLTKNAFTKLGYSFLGWSTNRNGKTIDYKDNQEIVAEKDIDLYPIWYSYKIFYFSNIPNDQNKYEEFVLKGEVKTLKDAPFTYKDHIFLGWNTNPNAKAVLYQNQQKVIDLTTEDIISFYAIWKDARTTIIFNSNDGVGVMEQLVISASKSQTTLPRNKFKKLGFKFMGWSISPSSSNIKYKNGAVLGKLTPGSTITLYAIWQDSTNTIYFDANGATGVMQSVKTSNSLIKLPKMIFNNPGYNFKGWALKKTLKTPKYLDQQEITFESSAGELRLYAIWKLVFDEEFFGITSNMDKNQKLSILSRQYLLYNQKMIAKDPEKKQEAKAIIDGITILRIRIKDGL